MTRRGKKHSSKTSASGVKPPQLPAVPPTLPPEPTSRMRESTRRNVTHGPRATIDNLWRDLASGWRLARLMRLPVVDVAVSIVRAPDGRVLMPERTARQISAAFCDLPGGNIDPGDMAEEAVVRELDEEIGTRPHQLRPWIHYELPFRTRRIRLQFFRVDR